MAGIASGVVVNQSDAFDEMTHSASREEEALMDQVGDGIYRLGTAIHNFCVIAEGGKATVIDAGCPRSSPSSNRALPRSA